jgi:small conductance mechanosensitive channel
MSRDVSSKGALATVLWTASAHGLVDQIADAPYSRELILTLLALIVVVIFIRLNGNWLKHLRNELGNERVDQRSVRAIEQVLDGLAGLVALFVILHIWGVESAFYGALTAVGIIGIILGFAFKDIGANLIAGVMLLFSKDFLVGDAIRVKDVEGRVSAIRLRTTTVERWDGAIAIVPNAVLINEPIVDFSAAARRRVEVQVTLLDGRFVAPATEAMRAIAEAHPRRVEGTPVEVLLQGFDGSSVRMELRLFVPTSDLIPIRDEITRAVEAALRERGIGIGTSTRVELER